MSFCRTYARDWRYPTWQTVLNDAAGNGSNDCRITVNPRIIAPPFTFSVGIPQFRLYLE